MEPDGLEPSMTAASASFTTVENGNCVVPDDVEVDVDELLEEEVEEEVEVLVIIAYSLPACPEPGYGYHVSPAPAPVASLPVASITDGEG